MRIAKIRHHKSHEGRTVMPAACAKTHVIKKLAATQPGALKLARRYGDALVCVRYRCDAEGLVRYTTVELLVDEAVIQKRKGKVYMVAIRLGEQRAFGIKERIKANGGEWDPQAYLWRLPRTAAKRLGLLGCVVAK